MTPWVERKEKLRLAAYRKLGNVCFCCGESLDVMLTVDHVNDGGKIFRRLGKRDSGHTLYSRVMKDDQARKHYRLACWNCNLGRQRAGTETCPHDRQG